MTKKLLCFFIAFTGYLCANSQNISVNDTVRKVKIAKGQTYLNFPVTETNKLTRAKISLGGKTLDQFTIKLATSNPDYWVYFDATPYQGQTLTVEISKSSVAGRGAFANTQTAQVVKKEENEDPAKGLQIVYADSKFPGQDSVYKEQLRPQVHFSAQRGWINDPNGLVYYKNEYHMYFQHNPYGWPWGNMHWGHAVSKDLVYWQQLPEAIYPVFTGTEGGRSDAAFSGSAFIDPNNTGGFRRNGIDPLIAMYSSTGRGECMMLSYDNGRTFEEYSGNPILKHNGRDPKVIWYAPGNNWVMVVWDQGVPKKIGLQQEAILRQHSIYTSNDLKTWTYQSGVEGFFECPELFQLPLDGESGVTKWVMYDAHGRYVVGSFDGKSFTVEQPFKQYEHGGGYFYASQTFSNHPDNKRIQVGWGRNITNPGMPFNQAQLFPTELRLKKTYDGYRLCPTPIPAISLMHANNKLIENKVVTSNAPVTVQVDPNAPIHVIAEFERGDAPITFNILGYELRYDNEWEFSTIPAEKTQSATAAPAGPFAPPTTATPVKYVSQGNTFKIEAIIDKNILEFFVNDGELYYVTEFAGGKTGKVEATVRAGGGPQGRAATARKFIVKKLEVHELNSIWKK